MKNLLLAADYLKSCAYNKASTYQDLQTAAYKIRVGVMPNGYHTEWPSLFRLELSSLSFTFLSSFFMIYLIPEYPASLISWDILK